MKAVILALCAFALIANAQTCEQRIVEQQAHEKQQRAQEEMKAQQAREAAGKISTDTKCTDAPPPPRSFCGFIFGEVYTNAATVSLSKPFRYCNQATICTTANEQKVFAGSISGTTTESMSGEDAQTEFQRMCEIVEKRFGIKMQQRKNHSEYVGSSLDVRANLWEERRGVKTFSVSVKRCDIFNADKNAAKKGAPPLPPDSGGEVL